jgi:small-conductance mechanosensitive channel
MNTKGWMKTLALGIWVLWGGLSYANEATGGDAPAEIPAPASDTLLSLEALQRSLALMESEADALQRQLAEETDEVVRGELRQQLLDSRQQIEDQRRQFDGFAMNIDLTPFSPQEESKFDWQEQVGKLLEPILAEFENATAESRLIGQLRTQMDDVGKRRDLAMQAVANLDALLGQPASPQLRGRLEARRKNWARVLDQLANEHAALELQLQSRLALRQSVLDQTTGYAKRFFQTRGLNLLLGIAAFLAVFFGFRLGERALRRLRRKGTEKKFSSRLTALLFHVFSVLGGLVAMMLVFNVAGDWFLLGIVIIFLFGVGWASINTLPQQIETIKLMLNAGAVREGEHLAYEGTPYRVESLGISAQLNNPLLAGGTRTLPVKYLVGLTSRPMGRDEALFPCEAGHWVALADGRTGSIASQTPATVEIVLPGGDRVTYPTTDFLGLHPRNLSGGFRVESTFGVDYRHQAAATAEIPNQLQAALQSELPEWVGSENLKKVQVAFSRANASSLDYAIWVDLAGGAAPLYERMEGAIQRILVDACTRNGWGIPFQQITLHQA